MSEITQMFKLLLNKEFYTDHKHKLPIHSFDDIGQDLLPTLRIAHEKTNDNISPQELLLMHYALNPTLTTANKNTFEVYIDNIKGEEEINKNVAGLVYSAMWRKEVGGFITNYGVRLGDGDHTDLDGLVSFLGKVGADFIPQDFSLPVDTDPINLFARLNQRGKWKLNIPTLRDRISSIMPGHFIIILARPECGKTAAIVNLIAGKEGFAAQGAKVHLIANEETVDSTIGRAICCYNELAFEEVKNSPQKAKTEGWDNVRKNMTFIHQPEMNLTQLDYYCKINAPNILIIDQLDHLGLSGNYETGHEKLSAIYRRTRELAAKHDTVIIGVCQASAEGEGRTKINFSMAEGSKTGKAAAADLIIGIGKTEDEEQGDKVLRYFTVSKNKISGWHGTVVTKLIKSESRLIA